MRDVFILNSHYRDCWQHRSIVVGRIEYERDKFLALDLLILDGCDDNVGGVRAGRYSHTCAESLIVDRVERISCNCIKHRQRCGCRTITRDGKSSWSWSNFTRA